MMEDKTTCPYERVPLLRRIDLCCTTALCGRWRDCPAKLYIKEEIEAKEIVGDYVAWTKQHLAKDATWDDYLEDK